MKKITDFIINKRHFILALFIILTIISSVLSTKVKINYDITKYLPNTSETRIGMDIMEKEFSETETSTLNLMFENLADEEKYEVKDYLEGIDGVQSVDYDNTEKYNKENYKLYVITVDDKSDSQKATDVYNQITEKYKGYTIYTGGSVSQTNKTVLSIWTVALAIVCALVILIIMCESYVEPFLFLTSILMAVILNKGTNIIFSSVSHITNSIVAILQLALSMDYSIMLMNRYNQEKELEKDKIKAMKKALYKAFKAISSSSITTIVGLLALVFMSFKIGRDLGFVLAKGVLFSLICIFFVLPDLILIFDKWIVKTKKRSPQIKLDKLGKFSYKIRYVAVPLFLVVFIGSFMLKGSLGIDYTETQSDEVAQIFNENNQIAIIYKNEDEEKISKFLKEIEDEGKVDEVLAYGNTINEKLTYDKLKEKLNDLGADVDVEDYLLRILYYDYYNPEKNNTLTFEEFVNFIEGVAYKNEKINNQINNEAKNNITRLKNFTTINSINKKRNSTDLANVLDIDKSKIDDVLIYYLSKNNNVQISVNEFIDFMNRSVLTNDKYSAKIDSQSRSKLNTLTKFTNKQTIQKKVTSNEMAQLFGINSDTMNELYKYYILVNDINIKMSISEFSNFVLNDVLNNSNYASSFDDATITNLRLLSKFSNKNTITRKMNNKELSNLFGMEESKINQVLLLKHIKEKNESQYTILEFINNINNIKTNTHYLDGLDTSGFEKLMSNKELLSDQTKHKAEEMSKMLNIDINQMYQLYNLIDYTTGNISNWTVTPNGFVKIILDNSKVEEIKNNVDEATMQKLKLLSTVMNSSINNTKYDYKELSQTIGIDSSNLKNIYTLYISAQNSTKLTPQEFVNFVLVHKSDNALANKVKSDTVKDLSLVQSVMNGVINNKKYNSGELSSLLGINKQDMDLLYGLYSSQYVNTNPTLSLKEIVEFLINDVTTNPEYSSNFDDKQITKLNTVNGIMNATINNTKYTSDEMFAIISNLTNDIDKNTVELLYIYYGSNNQYNEAWEMTVEQFVEFLNENILKDERFTDFISDDMRNNVIDSKEKVEDAKELLVGDNYSRIVINTKFAPESSDTFEFIQKIKDILGKELKDFYIIGDSPMAYEMSKTFNGELNFITIITMIAIFIVVAITFKSIIIPTILVLVIQCAVYLTMGILSVAGENVYFIALLIVQSILMGATIDYAILYTSYYLESRKNKNIKESVIYAYNNSIHTILTSSSILIIVTLIIANFASAIAAKICKTVSEGTLCSTILILTLLPAVLAFWDRVMIRNKK